jgi:hypothetical protein
MHMIALLTRTSGLCDLCIWSFHRDISYLAIVSACNMFCPACCRIHITGRLLDRNPKIRILASQPLSTSLDRRLILVIGIEQS